MRCMHEIYLRLPALGCTVLAGVATALMILSSTSCSFLKVKYAPNAPKDGIIISDFEDNVDLFRKYNIGLYCPSYYETDDDLMWKLARGFVIASGVLMLLTLSLSVGLSTCVDPSCENWKALTIIAISTAGLEIPIFLLYNIKPCKEESIECSAGSGFFLQLYSVIVIASLTIVTLCFNYPEWRDQIEGWKIKDRGVFVEDYYDYDVEPDDFVNSERAHDTREVLQRYSDSPHRVKSKIVPIHEDERTYEVAKDKKQVRKRFFRKGKSKAVDELYLMLDDIESGISDSPREYVHHKSLIDDDSIQNEDDFEEDLHQAYHKPTVKGTPETESLHATQYSDSPDRKKILGEDLPPSTPISPNLKTRSFKKGAENVTYVVLTDSDNEDDTHEDTNVIQFTPPEIKSDNGYANQQESSFTSADEDATDKYAASDVLDTSEKLDGVQVIEVTSGESQFVPTMRSSVPSLTASQSVSDDYQSIHVISDDENDDSNKEYDDFDDKGILKEHDDTQSLLQDLRLQPSDQDVEPPKYPIQHAKKDKKTKESSAVDIVASHSPAHHHLNALIANLSFFDAHTSYKHMKSSDDDINNSVDDQKWHDVLDSMSEDYVSNSGLHSRIEKDIDDEVSHQMMVEKLLAKHLQPKNLDDDMAQTEQTSQADTNPINAVVTDDEESVEIASETLYDNEVEV